MKTFLNEEINFPRQFALVEPYGLTHVGSNVSFAYGAWSSSTIPTLTFYTDLTYQRMTPPIICYEMPDATDNDKWQQYVTEKDNGKWKLYERNFKSPAADVPNYSIALRHFGYKRDATKGNVLTQLDFIAKRVQRLGYKKSLTAPILLLYTYLVGAMYGVDVLPSRKEALMQLDEAGKLLLTQNLSSDDKFDFTERIGTVADLEQVMSNGAPYNLVSDLFPKYVNKNYRNLA